MDYLPQYALILIVSAAVAAFFTPLAGKLGMRLGIVAVPGGRRKHTGQISRLGGIGLFAGYLIALLLSRLIDIPSADPHESRRFWGLLVGGVVLFILGVVDDRFELPAWAEYAGYLVAAFIAIGSLIILERFNNPLSNQLVVLPALLYIPLTIFWITGMTVTVNWLDGLDGLAAGVAAILSAVLSVHMYRSGQYSVVPLSVALLGASLGFLIFNIAPAKVYLGGTAFFLGYTLAALGLIAGGRVATVLMVMGIPIVDVAWTILDRMRHGLSPFKGDRRHLHFRLQDAGYSTKLIVGIYWLFCAISGMLGLLLSSRIVKLVALMFLGGCTILLLLYLSRDKTDV